MEKFTTLLPEVGYKISQSGISHFARVALDISERFQWESDYKWLSINHVEQQIFSNFSNHIGNCDI